MEARLRKGGSFNRLERLRGRRWFVAWLERQSHLRATKALLYFPAVWSDVLSLVSRVGATPDLLALRVACALSTALQHVEQLHGPFVVVGDGQGLLSALIKCRYPEATVYSIDPEPMLNVQELFHLATGLQVERVALDDFPVKK